MRRPREHDRVREAIAAVTGYEPESLRATDFFEDDLGIDAIKRARIARLLGLETSDGETIGDWLRAAGIEERQEAATRENETLGAANTRSYSRDELTELLLSITEQKTGYSRELLDLDADLEADLGVDTIKQAQILGQLHKHLPLPLEQGLRIKDYPTLRHWIELACSRADAPPTAASPRRFFVERRIDSLEPLAASHALSAPLATRSADSLVCLLPKKLGELKFALEHIQQNAATLKHVVIVTGAGGNFTTPTEVEAAFWGLGRTVAREWPRVRVRIIDIEREQGAEWATSEMLRELAIDDAPLEVGLKDGKRWALSTTPRPIDFAQDETAPTPPLDERSVVLITGGTRGLGAEFAKAIATRHKSTLILVGRNPAPETIAAIEAVGARAQFRVCDVSDAQALEALLQDVQREHGAITGVIHAAGLLEDGPIENKTWDSFKRVYDVKVEGARALLAHARRSAPRFFVFFSSVSGRFGNAAQCDYASANAAATALVTRFGREHPDCRTLSIAWGAWDEVGMAARTGVAELLKMQGQGAIALDDGLSALFDELGLSRGPSEAVLAAAPEPAPQAVVAAPEFPLLGQILEHAPGNRLRATATFSPRCESWLGDHALLGTTLLPATMAIELMTQAALCLLPGRVFRGLRDLRIHHAIRYGDGGAPIQVRAKARHGGEVAVSLETDAGGTHFEATVQLSPEKAEPRSAEFPTASAFATLSSADIYPARIPLGPCYQLVSSFEDDGRGSARARLEPNRRLADARSYSLPASREAGFHAAALMAQLASGRALIPGAISEMRHYHDDGFDEAVEVRARARDANTFDLFLLDSDGKLRAEILGYQTIEITGGLA